MINGLLLALLGVGVGYYFYSQKRTKELTNPELQPTGEIKYPSSMVVPSEQKPKTQAIYDFEKNQIKIQPKPIKKKDFIFIPNPITIDIGQIINKLRSSKPISKSPTQTTTITPTLVEKSTPTIEEILRKTLEQIEI